MTDSGERLLEVARKHCIKNRHDYGRAEVGSVAGKVIAEFPDSKRDMKATMACVNEQVAKVNALSPDAVEKEYTTYNYDVAKEEKDDRLTLPHCQTGKVVTRFAPEPSGHPHIGHAKAAWLARKLANDWQGSMYLRFDDTNPEKETQEFVDALQKEMAWLGITFKAIQYASDEMPRFYEYAEKLVNQGDAFACFCSQEEIKAYREKRQACPHRGATVADNLAAWKKMIGGGFGEGEVVLRLKGDLASQNTVMLDPTIFRVIKAPHYRQGEKYHAWPNYDFEVSIADSTSGVTHCLRSKEYELRDELYAFILDKLELRRPFVYDFSRLDIKGTLLSKRFLRPLIENGKVSGWDDPRLPTIAGLRRRGMQPEALKNFVLSFGLSKVESKPGWTALVTENRRLLDPIAERRFFVPDPIPLTVENAPEKTITLKNHPTQDRGSRDIDVKNKFLIPKNDTVALKVGDVLRLKDLYSVRVAKAGGNAIEAVFLSESLPGKTVQWVPDDPKSFSRIVVIKPLDLVDAEGEFNENSLETVEGAGEKSCDSLPNGAIIQFERFGFVRKDSPHGYVYVG